MTSESIVSLLKFLDDLFQLGGKLVSAAMEKVPELNTEPLNDLDLMDTARSDALQRNSTNK